MPSAPFLSVFFNRFGTVFRSIGALSERRIVSKPQILSRLRYVNIIKRCDETAQEKAYRIQYQSLQDWNNKYWAENNELFKREMNEYIEKNFGSHVSDEAALSHDQLASFYQDFLERNREKHVNYNRVWYRHHLALLVSSMNAKMSRIKANIASQ